MNNYVKLLSGLALCMSISAHAALVQVSGSSFDDRGASTVDLTGGLEWLDIGNRNRSACSVIADAGGLIPSGCNSFDGQDLIADADGWRLATRAEAAGLLSRWFGLVIGERDNGYVDPDQAQHFLNVFADGQEVRPNFFPDSQNEIQAVGFYVSAGGHYNMDFYNGDINYGGFGTALVRAAQVQAEVPEPGSMGLLALALPALIVARRRRKD